MSKRRSKVLLKLDEKILAQDAVIAGAQAIRTQLLALRADFDTALAKTRATRSRPKPADSGFDGDSRLLG